MQGLEITASLSSRGLVRHEIQHHQLVASEKESTQYHQAQQRPLQVKARDLIPHHASQWLHQRDSQCVLRRGVQLIQRSSGRANPAVQQQQQQPRRAVPALLVEILEQSKPPSSLAALSQSSNAPRAAGTQPRVPANLRREHEITPREQPGSSRRQPHAPVRQPYPLGQRNSECAPHAERLEDYVLGRSTVTRRKSLMVIKKTSGDENKRDKQETMGSYSTE